MKTKRKLKSLKYEYVFMANYKRYGLARIPKRIPKHEFDEGYSKIRVF